MHSKLFPSNVLLLIRGCLFLSCFIYFLLLYLKTRRARNIIGTYTVHIKHTFFIWTWININEYKIILPQHNNTDQWSCSTTASNLWKYQATTGAKHIPTYLVEASLYLSTAWGCSYIYRHNPSVQDLPCYLTKPNARMVETWLKSSLVRQLPILIVPTHSSLHQKWKMNTTFLIDNRQVKLSNDHWSGRVVFWMQTICSIAKQSHFKGS